METVLAKLWRRVEEIIQPRYRVLELEELPAGLADYTLYIIGEGEYRWYAAMLCPCGCKDTIYLNLRSDEHPHWRLIQRKSSISIEPSIWRQKGCRSHFFLRRSKIQWCRRIY